VSVAAVARQHGVNASLLFGWCRLHRRGLLDAAAAAAPEVLPVKITEPTITPTQRWRTKPKNRCAIKPVATGGSGVEIIVGEQLRIRLATNPKAALPQAPPDPRTAVGRPRLGVDRADLHQQLHVRQSAQTDCGASSRSSRCSIP